MPTLLEQFAAAENAAMREVMRDDRGVKGIRPNRLTQGFSQKDRAIIQRAKQLCAGCGTLCQPTNVYHYRGDRMCSQQCLDDVKRWNRWTRSDKI